MFDELWQSIVNYELSRLVTILIVAIGVRVFLREHLRYVFNLFKSRKLVSDRLDSISERLNKIEEKL